MLSSRFVTERCGVSCMALQFKTKHPCLRDTCGSPSELTSEEGNAPDTYTFIFFYCSIIIWTGHYQ